MVAIVVAVAVEVVLVAIVLAQVILGSVVAVAVAVVGANQPNRVRTESVQICRALNPKTIDFYQHKQSSKLQSKR